MATVEKAFIKKKGYLYKLPLSPGIIKVISKLEMQQVQKGDGCVFVQVWSKRWVVLYSTSREGVVRVEYYDSEEDQIKVHNKRNIHLRNCTSCERVFEFKRFAFAFTTHLGKP